jgi:hypothetical protein
MTFEEFKAIIDLMVDNSKRVDAIYDLKIDLLEFNDDNQQLVCLLWRQLLTEEGYDWLQWFLYEKNYIHDGKGRKEMNAWDENGKEICRNLKDTYIYLTKQKYFKTK